MKVEEQYQELKKIKSHIDKQLQAMDRDVIKNLTLGFFKPGNMKRLFLKDNQLFMLNCFCSIWISERKKLTPLHMEQDIFKGIHSLEDVEEKYLALKFGVLRIEQSMPREYCEQAVDYFIGHEVSGIALNYVIKNETWKREKNLIALARLLKEKGEYATAVILLQEGEESYPGNRDILLELSDCWMQAQVYGEAKKCLMKIKRPGKTIKNLICELEKMEAYEVV